MIKRFIFYLSLVISLAATGQGPVQWKYGAEKIGDNLYKVTLTANIAEPWHIYSQQTPDGGPLPTSIKFAKNPMLLLEGQPNEEGNLEVYHEEAFGTDVYAYSIRVDFIQTVRLKVKGRTAIQGNVEYMACKKDKCLVPTTYNFKIFLN